MPPQTPRRIRLPLSMTRSRSEILLRVQFITHPVAQFSFQEFLSCRGGWLRHALIELRNLDLFAILKYLFEVIDCRGKFSKLVVKLFLNVHGDLTRTF